jgi:hypothetical protein
LLYHHRFHASGLLNLMLRQDDLPASAAALMRRADAHSGSDEALMIAQIFLSSAHPDFLISPAAVRLLHPELRAMIAGFLQEVLIDGLNEQQRNCLFAWAQAKMLAGPGAPRHGV